MVNWENYVWENDREIDLTVINNFADAHAISFPKEYLDLVTKNQGKSPAPENFKLKNSDFVGTVNVLLHFDDDESEKTYNVNYNYEIGKEYLPEDIVPFASTINSDLLCFDFRTFKDNPHIVLASHEYSGEDAIFPVADSFSEFLNNLHSGEE